MVDASDELLGAENGFVGSKVEISVSTLDVCGYYSKCTKLQ